MVNSRKGTKKAEARTHDAERRLHFLESPWPEADGIACDHDRRYTMETDEDGILHYTCQICRAEDAERQRDEARAACAVRQRHLLQYADPKGLNGEAEQYSFEEATADDAGQSLLDKLTEAEADSLHLRVILAVIHRDGGQHTEAVGIAQSVKDAREAWAYLRQHHDDCHQPAASYQLLLDRLAGTPTNHGNCPVAAQLDTLEAENERLRGIVLHAYRLMGPRAHHLGCKCCGRDSPDDWTCAQLTQAIREVAEAAASPTATPGLVKDCP